MSGRSGARTVLCSVLSLALALPGCATQTPTSIVLSGVVRDGAAVSGSIPPETMQLVRAGVAYHVNPDMQLLPGDTLRTGATTHAVVSFPGGARAYVYPASQVRIGSLFQDIGKVFIKVKGAFKVQTRFVTAGSEGTEYWVDVRPNGDARVVVAEDVVTLESPASAWPPQRLTAGQQAVYRSATPGTMSMASPAEIRGEREWVQSLDRMVPVKTTLSPWLMLVPIAIGVGAAAGGGRDRDRDRRGEARRGGADARSNKETGPLDKSIRGMDQPIETKRQQPPVSPPPGLR